MNDTSIFCDGSSDISVINSEIKRQSLISKYIDFHSKLEDKMMYLQFGNYEIVYI